MYLFSTPVAVFAFDPPINSVPFLVLSGLSTPAEQIVYL